jgi:23S rRNA (guanine2445-N2)-methyltransferase / 23S rRNA (guanine2069-N7)-methyltransferase
VLLPIGKAGADSVEALYEGVRAIPWENHLSPDGTLAVDFQSDANPAFRNTMFGAQKVKDAVVDRLRDRFGRRPSVDAAAPDVRINARVRSGAVTISLDLSGEALHRRGYREAGVQGPAPLKESLAAAMLLLAGWREIAGGGGALVDPMCGSGTLLIEGAWIAGDVAPGLLRAHWGFTGWLGHDADGWDDLVAAADDRAEAGLAHLPPIVGYDSDVRAVELAAACVARAGLRGRVTLEKRGVVAAVPPIGATSGLVVANPPYGERLGETSEVRGLYAAFGRRLRECFGGWRYAVLAGDESHASAFGVVPSSTHELYNGTIPVRLDTGAVPSAESPDITGGASAFANRLRKNRKHLGKWAKREGVKCWRVYDADLPDFAVAIDLYECEDGVRRAVVSEYQAPPEIDAVKTSVRLDQAVAAVADVLDVAPGEVRVKVRRRQRGEAQYEQLASTGRFHLVEEGSAHLRVNLDDYLDTGLFLDHRLTRGMVAELAVGGSLLNLFCYTAAATARAVVAGAASSDSVDLSNTYCEWARRNLALNGADPSAHRVVRADVLRFIEEAARVDGPRFDVVFCDPPSFSTSNAMQGTFDVQRDHIGLVRGATALLAGGGVLVFSTNLRTFRLDAEALNQAGLAAEDVTRDTIPPDFERSPRIHRCFIVRRA